MHILVTGSTGYIGSRFIKRALEGEHKISFASRHIPPSDDEKYIYFDLNNTGQISLPNEIDAVVHLAANTSNVSDIPSEEELQSAKILVKAAKKIGAKFLFVSSQTAQSNLSSGYGKTKWLIEKVVLNDGGFVVRPGLVYGGSLNGLFGTLANVVDRLPVLPKFYPSPQVQPIHIDDLILCLIRILEDKNITSRIFYLGQEKPISFNKFLCKLSELRFRSKKFTVPAPVFFINVILSFPLFPVWRKKFKSLVELPNMEVGDSLSVLNVNLRSLDDGMSFSVSPGRRILLLEASALLKYILRTNPGPALLKRYVRALESLGNVTPLRLPSEFIAFPFLISFINLKSLRPSQFQVSFENRLNLSAALAESTLVGARRFIKSYGSGSTSIAVFELFNALLRECFCRLIGGIFSGLIRIRFNQTRSNA